MKSVALILAGVVLLGFAAQSPVLPKLLTDHMARLQAASSVEIKYTFRVIGESPTDYKLALGRPKMFKLESSTGYVVADGTKFVTYTKATNTYTEAPLTDEVIAEFSRRPEVLGWSGFLLKEPATEFVAAKSGTTRNLAGNEVTEVEASLKGGKVLTFFMDKKLGLARAFSIKDADKQYLATATELVIKTDALTPEGTAAFAFAPPAGAKKEEAAATPTFAQVQPILTANCMPCHSARNRKAEVDLSNYEGTLATVNPGSAKTSKLIRSLHAPGMSRMPKNAAPLSPAVESVLVAWIDAGAKK